MDRRLCAHDDCDNAAWGDELHCRRHLIADSPWFTPVETADTPVTVARVVIDDGIEIYPPNQPASAGEANTSESE